MVRAEKPRGGPGLKPAGVLTAAGVGLGARRLLPVALFVIPFGLAFGGAAVEAGLTPGQSIVMSATVFAGASQFAALDLWQAPIPYLSLALVVLAVNARHIILGAALSGRVNALPWGKRLPALLLLSDANFADSQAAFKSGERDVGVLVGGGVVLWATWVLGTAVGAHAGALIGSLSRYGVDVVMATYFAAVIVGGLKTRAALVPVAVAATVAVATLEVLPAGWNIIAAALCGGVAGVFRHGR